MTDTTVPDRPSPRQMLAHIALRTDLPLPHRITFEDDAKIRLAFDADLDGARQWIEALDGGVYQTTTDTAIYVNTHFPCPRWHGWEISVIAVMDLPERPAEPPLDESTRDALTALVREPATPPKPEHQEAGAWAGDPWATGQCGIGCTCGVNLDGYDSVADAQAALQQHIDHTPRHIDHTPRQAFINGLRELADWYELADVPPPASPDFLHCLLGGDDARPALEQIAAALGVEIKPGVCPSVDRQFAGLKFHAYYVSRSEVDTSPADLDERASDAAPPETTEHHVAEGGGNIRDGYGLTCSCGYETDNHSTSEDADGEMGQHMRDVAGDAA